MDYTIGVRRLLAISMMLLFGFTLVLPLFASDASEASLPACCRRNGKHHCSMPAWDAKQGRQFTVVSEKCPCPPATPAVSHLSNFALPADRAAFAGVISHPAIHAQTAAQYRISFDRSRQKRGPPSLTLL